MTRDLQEYANYIIKRYLEDLKGQDIDFNDLPDRLDMALDGNASFIYTASAINFIKHCWDDVQELVEPDICAGNILTNPEGYAYATAAEAVRQTLGGDYLDELMDQDEVRVTDEVIAKLTAEMHLDDYRVIDGKDPEDRLMDDYAVEAELAESFGKNFDDYIQGYICDELDNLKGQDIYADDLASRLTETDNINGSVFCSTYKAEEFIKQYWDEAVKTMKGLNNEYGYSDGDVLQHWNPLTKPEAFQFVMTDEGVRCFLGKSDYLNNKAGESILLDDLTIARIKEDLGLRASLDRDAVITIPEDEKYENYYFLTSKGDVLEWKHDDFANEPDPADFELDDDSQEELQRRQDAYDNDEVFIPTVYDRNGSVLDTDTTNYGLEVNAGGYELVAYLGQCSDIEQCLEWNKEAINEQAQKTEKSKSRGM